MRSEREAGRWLGWALALAIAVGAALGFLLGSVVVDIARLVFQFFYRP